MLINEKLQAAVGFTSTDQAIALVVLSDPQEAAKLTMQELADKAHCSHSAVDRFCKRLGFSGFHDFSLQLTRESSVPNTVLEDANFPFSANDTLREATDKVTELSLNAIKSTRQRLDMQAFVQAIQHLNKARRIILYGHGDSGLLVQDFANKLNKIDIYPIFADQYGETSWNTTNVTSADCALFVSYRGQNHNYEQVMRYLDEQHVAAILVTGRPTSPLATLAKYVLEVPGDEFDFMKIGTISSQIAIEYLLTLVFSGIYARHYDNNLAALKDRQALLTTGPLAEDGQN